MSLSRQINGFGKITESFKDFNVKYFFIFNNREDKRPFNYKGKNVIFVTNDDKVYVYGENRLGSLGFTHHDRVGSPTAHRVLENKKITNFYNGSYHVIATNGENEVYCWGYNNYAQLGRGTKGNVSYVPEKNLFLSNQNISDVCCGDYHSLALSSDGRVFAWGDNQFGQVGNESNRECEPTPIQLNAFNGLRIASISCGSMHSMALTETGIVFSWGYNNFGQLGIGSDKNSNKPIALIRLNEVKTTKISCSQENSYFISNDGYIYVCGKSYLEKSKTNQKYPARYYSDIRFEDIKSNLSQTFSIAISSDKICYEIGKIGSIKIKTPKETPYISPYDYYAEKFQITIKTIELTKTNSAEIEEYPSLSQNTNTLQEIQLSNRAHQVENIQEKEREVNVQNVIAQSNNVKLLDQRENEGLISQTSFKSASVDHKVVGRTFSYDGRYVYEFEQLNELGKGGFGHVYRAKNKENQQVYAIKIITIKDVDITASLSKEIKAMADLQSDHVVQYYSSWCEYNNTLYIQMELCYCTLKTILEEKLKEFGRMNNSINQNDYTIENSSDTEAIMSPTEYFITSEILKEIIDSLDYLHNHEPPIIHRDLKPDNILISKGKNRKFVKIADFGLAAFHNSPDQDHTKFKGTDRYAAPEVKYGKSYDMTADIHSLGVITQQMFNIDINSQYVSEDKLVESKFKILCGIVIEMVNHITKNRPSTKQLLENMGTWALTLTDIESNSEFMKFKEAANIVNRIEDSFLKFFLKKKLDWMK